LAGRYAYVWEFRVAPEHREAFERHYGPTGSWVTLFRESPGYIESWLLRDQTDGLRYLTIDRWESAAAYRLFRARFAEQYAALDRLCEHLTTCENSLGHYAEAAG
jgi:heme-degrading monooxygenase HmoA